MKLTLAASLLFSSMLASGAYWAATVIPASHSQIDGMTAQIDRLETLVRDRVHSQIDRKKEFGDSLIPDSDGMLRFDRTVHCRLHGGDSLNLPDGFRLVYKITGEADCRAGWYVETIEAQPDGDHVITFAASDDDANRDAAYYHSHGATHRMKVVAEIAAD